MGFREARARVLDCLRQGNYSHWPRKDAYRKNWLQFGRLTEEKLRTLLLVCQGNQHRESKHDFDAGIVVHEFLPVERNTRWYIKVYFDPDVEEAVFMSVHPSGE